MFRRGAFVPVGSLTAVAFVAHLSGCSGDDVSYQLGGTVSGLVAGHEVTLLNNGGDATTVTAKWHLHVSCLRSLLQSLQRHHRHAAFRADLRGCPVHGVRDSHSGGDRDLGQLRLLGADRCTGRQPKCHCHLRRCEPHAPIVTQRPLTPRAAKRCAHLRATARARRCRKDNAPALPRAPAGA